jgi:N-methylhydantoinase B
MVTDATLRNESLEADPVVLEVMRNELLGITEEMNITLQRTTRSVAAKETNDFSSTLLDVDGEIIMQKLPYGISVFHNSMPHVMAKMGGQFKPGDVLLCNDPYKGLSHLPDIMVVMPIFEADQLIGFAATFQHHTDIGGRFPGGFGTQSRELYEEGLLLPIVHFYRGGVRDSSVHDIIAANVRAPADVLGDLEANAAACRRGASGFSALVKKYGYDRVRRCSQELMRHSERRIRELIRNLPQGEFRAQTSFSDGEGTTFDFVLTLRITGDDLVIDMTGSSPQSAFAWNLPPGLSLQQAVISLLGMVGDRDAVITGGLIRPVRLVAPVGSIVNPTFPGAVSSRAQGLQRLNALLTEALGMASPGSVPANGDCGPTVLVFRYRREAESGVMTDIWHGGWGARARSDGIDGIVAFGSTGFRTTSAEVMEGQAPVALEGFGFVPDTAGIGKFRGTVSVFRTFRFLCEGRAMLRTMRVGHGGEGMDGGGEGKPASAFLTRQGVRTQLPEHSQVELDVLAGDVLEHIMPGGGGYGDPYTRDENLVLADFLDEKLSLKSARADYRVVIDPTSRTIDVQETRLLRR